MFIMTLIHISQMVNGAEHFLCAYGPFALPFGKLSVTIFCLFLKKWIMF